MVMKKIVKKIIPKRIKEWYKKTQINIIKTDLRDTECIYKLKIDDTKKFENKVAIVTGGSGAIGSAISFRLAMEGAFVYVAGRNIDNISRVVNMIRENNGNAVSLVLDVTKPENIENEFKKIYDEHGRIDIIVNNAGGSSRKQSKILVDQDINVIDMVLDSNLRGTILCCKYVAKYMINSKSGKIINIGSTTGLQGNMGNVDYAASKSGIIGLTKALAKELGEYNINVNCVSPGRINQIMFDEILDDIKDDGAYLLRKGKTGEVSSVVTFLASDEASFITGQNFVVDGGRSLGLKGD